LFAARKRAGRATTPLDLMIAAIAHANGAAVVARDAGGFDGCDITVINPWEDEVRR
jgi:predicted nucleic acid-binding protein